MRPGTDPHRDAARRGAERFARLLAGLVLYGFSIALMIEGAVGAAPWDVFHVGVARHLPLSLGMIVVLTSLVVLLAWIPLRQRPGPGTVANALLIGPFADASLFVLPSPTALAVQIAFMLAGVLVCGLATAMYIGAQLGPGPRDGLMTGLARRTGWSIRRVRTLLEVSVLAAGALLGGQLGLGTVVFALAIGPITQFFLPRLTVPVDPPRTPGDHVRPAPPPRGAMHPRKARRMNTMTATHPAAETSRSHAGGRLLYRIDGSFSEIIPIGPVADGFRLNGHFGGPVTAGPLTGAQMTGVDYFRLRSDGLGVVRGHEVVTAGDSVVAVEIAGYLRPPAGVDAPLPGDVVKPGFAWPEQPYTIHVSATFETADPELAYLNETVVAHSGTINFSTGQLQIDAHVIG